MAVYTWLCECGECTAVERKIADIDILPESCKGCSSTNQFKQRIILPPSTGVKGFILLDTGSGFHNHNYTRYRSIK